MNKVAERDRGYKFTGTVIALLLFQLDLGSQEVYGRSAYVLSDSIAVGGINQEIVILCL
jgi:hypothetical protein